MTHKEEIIKAFEHFVSKKGEGVILYNDDGSVIKLQDVVDLIAEQKAEIERFNDIRFTQEHCNLYEENEWLKEILRQYMNGELISEDVFCQQVKDTQEVIKYTAKEIFEKIFESLCVFSTVGQSKEYNEGYVQAISDCDDRIQKVAKECGVEVE